MKSTYHNLATLLEPAPEPYKRKKTKTSIKISSSTTPKNKIECIPILR